jgi:hypothetical protein
MSVVLAYLFSILGLKPSKGFVRPIFGGSIVSRTGVGSQRRTTRLASGPFDGIIVLELHSPQRTRRPQR